MLVEIASNSSIAAYSRLSHVDTMAKHHNEITIINIVAAIFFINLAKLSIAAYVVDLE
jgi:hypothetical protein